MLIKKTKKWKIGKTIKKYMGSDERYSTQKLHAKKTSNRVKLLGSSLEMRAATQFVDF